MADRSHLSIGEVLSLLRDEFPDVTISKIRFLESQGLVDPERTPSGYRKFYDHDVERLRWILRQQRENFLPLKVIKGRLSDHDDDDTAGLATGELDEEGSPPSRLFPDEGEPGADPGVTPHPFGDGADVAGPGGHQQGPAGPGGHQQGPAAERPPEPASAQENLSASIPSSAAPHLGGDEDASFTQDELMARSGLDARQVDELGKFGLITPERSGGTDYYDGDAVAVAVVAAGFASHGVEARHLRAWRNAAEREVTLFEQLVMPLLRQRNPQARTQAASTLDELAGLGASLRDILVRKGIRRVH